MTRIAPFENDTLTGKLEKHLWDDADKFRAKANLKVWKSPGLILSMVLMRSAPNRKMASPSMGLGNRFCRDSCVASAPGVETPENHA